MSDIKHDFFGDDDLSTREYREQGEPVEQSDDDKKKAHENYMLFTSVNDGERQRWAYDCWENFQFFKGVQMTRAEREKYKEAKTPIYIVNMVTPAIELMKYFITANKPMWKYSAVESSDTDAIEIFRALSDYCYTKSNGHLKLSKIVLDCLTRSVGYMNIYGDANKDRGKGEVVFDFLDFDNVLVDPASKDPFARDANYIIVAKNVSRSGLKNLLPQFVKEINGCSDSGTITTVYAPNYGNENEFFQEMDTAFDPRDGREEDFLPYYEVYRKIRVRMNNITLRQILPEEEKVAIQERYDEELQVKEQEIKVQLAETQAALQARLDDPDNPIIQERYDFDYAVAQREAEGSIAQIREQFVSMAQDELNPTINIQLDDVSLSKLKKDKGEIFDSLVIEHGIYYETRINVRVSIGVDTFLYEKTLPVKNHIIIPLPYLWDGTLKPLSAVKMLKDKQKEINKIRQIVIQHADKITNNAWISEKGQIQNKNQFKKELNTVNGIAEYAGGEEARRPTPVEPQQIPNSFYALLSDSKTDFEFLSGITSHLMGAVQTNDEPYKLAMARDEFSTRRLRSWITSTFEPWLEQVGKVFVEVSKAVYTSHKVFRITQPDTGKEQTFEMNIPVFNDKSKIIDKIFDYGTIEFDVSIKQNSTLPTNKDALEEKLFRLYKENIIDEVYYLKRTEMSDVDALLQRKSVYANQVSHIEKQEEEIKSLRGDIETLRRQLLQSDLRYEHVKNSFDIKKEVQETQSQQKLLRQMEKLQVELKMKEADLTIKEKTLKDKEAGKKEKSSTAKEKK